MGKELKECNHQWSTGATIYNPPKCDKCGETFEELIPE